MNVAGTGSGIACIPASAFRWPAAQRDIPHDAGAPLLPPLLFKVVDNTVDYFQTLH